MENQSPYDRRSTTCFHFSGFQHQPSPISNYIIFVAEQTTMKLCYDRLIIDGHVQESIQ